MQGTAVLMAGFGGQGMLLAGKVLAHAAMAEGLQVSWLPSYGPEMRGGTANVTVCVSPRPIGSPLITNPKGLLVMNLPSLEKFAPKVEPGGVIVVNASLVSKDPERPDCTVLAVDARACAENAGTARAANFVMLGAYVGLTGIVDVETVVREVEREMAAKPKFIEANVAALRAGVEEGRKARVAT